MDIIKKKTRNSDPYESYDSFIRNSTENPYQKKNSARESTVRKTEKDQTSGKLWKVIFFVMVFLLLAWGGFFVFKIGTLGKKISVENETPSVIDNVGSLISSLVPNERKLLDGENEGRVNILLLGTAGKGKPGQNLTDTIMIMSLDTKNKKVALLSLPRDFYVNIPGTSYSTKINSIYQYGLNSKKDLEPMKKTVKEIIGTDIHYFIILNFDGFKKIIDDVGGINAYVERDIYDPRYPGPNYSYETFEIKKGIHLMDGETALKYARERHDDPEGDFGRAKRQQQVMQAFKNKVFSIQTFLNPFTLNNIIDDLGDNIKTDIKIEEIEGFVDLIKKSDTQNVTNVVVDAWKKDSILKVSHVLSGGVSAFVLVPRVGNYSEIQELSQNIFNLDEIRRRKAEIEKESASITIINSSSSTGLDLKIKDILENKLLMKDVKIGYSAASQKLEKSIIYDKTGGKKIFTLDEIIKKLGVTFSENKDAIIEEQNSDLVLILGTDLKKIEMFEEDSIEEFRNAEEKQEYFDLIEK